MVRDCRQLMNIYVTYNLLDVQRQVALCSDLQLMLPRTHFSSILRDKELSSINFPMHQPREMEIPPKLQGPVVPEQERGQFQKLCRDEIESCDIQSFLTVQPLWDLFHSKMASWTSQGTASLFPPILLPSVSSYQDVSFSLSPGNRIQTHSLFSCPKVYLLLLSVFCQK